jgi:hypothetical protein
VYDRVDFALAKSEDGGLSYVHKSADAYRTSDRGLKLLNAIVETHKGAVESTESYVAEREVTPEPTATQQVKDAFQGTDVTAETDDIPF